MSAEGAEQTVQNLRTAIENAGLSQMELSRRSGVPVASVNRFLHAKQDLTFYSAARLAAVLGLELRPVRRKKSTG